MNSIRNWMRKSIFATAVVAGVLGLGATTAQASEVRIYARGPVAYVPPSPGPGYVWIAGYRANGYWVPGRWNYGGYWGHGPYVRGYAGWGRGPVAYRHFDRGHFRR